MKQEVEGLRDLYKPTRPTVPLGPNAMGDGKGQWAAPAWQDPDDGYTQEEWDAWDAQQNAEHAERQRLDAIGKGKGRDKGKGKGKGGKGKGKGGERIVRDPIAPETRDCHNCHKPGHLARDCPEPDSAQTRSGQEPDRGSSTWQSRATTTRGTDSGRWVEGTEVLYSCARRPGDWAVCIDCCGATSQPA